MATGSGNPSLRQVYRKVRHAAMQPFRSRFYREMEQLDHAEDDGTLDRLRSFEEMKKSAWLGLGGIGLRLVRRFRPRVIVELGTHMGLSALAMGIGLKELGEGGQLFAVDTWEGEEHAGRYDNSVYETFMRRRQELGLEDVVVPLRMLFDDARDRVPTPIDLLHIDGLHTWDAVSHDWATFGPLVRPGGIVIFHDINTEAWAEVGRFWKQLSPSYENYGVGHSHGLGILRVPETGLQPRFE